MMRRSCAQIDDEAFFRTLNITVVRPLAVAVAGGAW